MALDEQQKFKLEDFVESPRKFYKNFLSVQQRTNLDGGLAIWHSMNNKNLN